ncbi:MAG TPA: protein kinase [Vicinamibacterales bacterium]
MDPDSLPTSGPFVHAVPSARASYVGPYRVLHVLGEGGMGTVYVAEQEHPVRRRVAVKVIRAGMDSARVVARFEAERQAQAMMDHANIAKVFDAGTTETGLPYLVMELVDGVPVTRYCDEHQLRQRDRLELFVPVCRAIQHAHQRGVIHRDIKPSNVLVTVCDGMPVPKVIDFGLVKATEQRLTEMSMLTEYGEILGTLDYMAPEQAELAEDVDTRSDIYSLGVLLYRLLTGTTPLGPMLREVTITDALRLVRDDQPPRPSERLASRPVHGDAGAVQTVAPAGVPRLIGEELDWIVMKCLEKDRTLRYESAGALARDVERHLADEPVEACPPSTIYRVRRFARRHRKSLATAAALLVLLLAGVVVSTWQAVRATRAERLAHDAALLMQAERDRARIALTGQVAERLDGDLRRLAMAGTVLGTMVAQRRDWNAADFERQMRAVLGQDERIFGMALALEPNQLVSGQKDFCLYVFRGAHGIEVKQLLPPEYVPMYREWAWYRRPLEEGRESWSDPYLDVGGGNIPMVTFSSPIRRNEAIVGVVTLDLSVRYFEVLRSWLDELRVGERSYGFVVSRSGVFISHPHGDYDFARARQDQAPRLTDMAAREGGDATLAQLLRQDGTGSRSALDPASGKRSAFLFAPVPSADWKFVAVVECDESAATCG